MTERGQEEAPGAQPLETVTEAPEPRPRDRATEKDLVDTIMLCQDASGYEPLFKYVTLNLWSDGSVTWKQDA